MTVEKLPPPRLVGVPQTLEVLHNDGSFLEVPYFCREGAMAFLSLEEDVLDYRVKDY